ncbi:hypothetical protein ACFL28_05280, partial [Candidatus Omnitrophota bacterium]
MKKIGIIILILILLGMGLLIAKDAMIKRAIEDVISIATGLKVDIGRLKVSILKTFISIDDVIILNPEQFDDRIMLDAPQIYIDYDLGAIFRKKIHLNDMRIDLRGLTIVKTAQGTTNLDSIKNLKKEKKRGQKKSPKRSNLEIDNLELKIGTLTYKDYSGGGEPRVSRFKINLEARYKNVKNTSEIMRIIVARALINTAIGGFSDFS